MLGTRHAVRIFPFHSFAPDFAIVSSVKVQYSSLNKAEIANNYNRLTTQKVFLTFVQ